MRTNPYPTPHSAPAPGILPILHASIIGLPELPPTPLARITPSSVARLFPQTPIAHIEANLPHVLTALSAAGLTDTPMLLAALATIRAEAETFLPLTEQPSPFNTSPGGHPFDLYDHYARYASLTGRDLLTQPALACEPAAAATLLARFLADRATAIRRALAAGDLAHARRLVNGGSNGLDRFASTIHLGAALCA